MKKGLFLVVLSLLFLAGSCARKEEPAPVETGGATTPAAAASTPGQAAAAEATHPFRGKIVSRDPSKNEVTVEGEKVEGVMEAMTMAYEVRGAKVETLPADGSAVRATLHEENGRYWLTDITPE